MRLRKKGSALFLVVLLALPVLCVYVSPTGSDSDDGSLSTPVETLSKAFELCGSPLCEIRLNPGTYQAFTTGSLSTTVTLISTSLSPAETTILCRNAPFLDTSGSIEASGITFADCGSQASVVGALKAGQTATVSNCVFSEPRAIYGSGAAISAAGAITIQSSDFSNCWSRWGACVSGASVTVTGSTFFNSTCTETNGGAVQASSTLSVSNSTFTECTAALRGGALAASVVDVETSTFDENMATWGGTVWASTEVTISYSTITNSHATDGGGAVYSPGDIISRYSSITGSQADNIGGAFYSDGEVSVVFGSVTQSSAPSCSIGAGAAFHTAGATVTGDLGTDFCDNDAVVCSEGYASDCVTCAPTHFPYETEISIGCESCASCDSGSSECIGGPEGRCVCLAGYYGPFCQFLHVYVDATGGSDSGDGSEEDPLQTICAAQAAIGLSMSPDLNMYLSPGTYSFAGCSDTLNTASLIGVSSNAADVIVQGMAVNNHVAVRHVTLDGCNEFGTVQHMENVVITSTSAMSFPTAARVLLTDCTVDAPSISIESTFFNATDCVFDTSVSLSSGTVSGWIGTSFTSPMTLEDRLTVEMDLCSFAQITGDAITASQSQDGGCSHVRLSGTSFGVVSGSALTYLQDLSACDVELVTCTFTDVLGPAIVSSSHVTANGLTFSGNGPPLCRIVDVESGADLQSVEIDSQSIQSYDMCGSSVHVADSGASYCGFGFAGDECTDCATGFYGDNCICRSIYISETGSDVTGRGDEGAPYQSQTYAEQFICGDAVLKLMPGEYDLSDSGSYSIEGVSVDAVSVVVTGLAILSRPIIKNFTIASDDVTFETETVVQNINFQVSHNINMTTSNVTLLDCTFETGTVHFQGADFLVTDTVFNDQVSFAGEAAGIATVFGSQFLSLVVITDSFSLDITDSYFSNTAGSAVKFLNWGTHGSRVSASLTGCKFQDVLSSAVEYVGDVYPDPIVLDGCTYTSITGPVFQVEGKILSSSGNYSGLGAPRCKLFSGTVGATFTNPTVADGDFSRDMVCGPTSVIIAAETLCGFQYAGEGCSQCEEGFSGDTCALRDMVVSHDGSDVTGLGTVDSPVYSTQYAKDFSASNTDILLVANVVPYGLTSSSQDLFGIGGLTPDRTAVTVSDISPSYHPRLFNLTISHSSVGYYYVAALLSNLVISTPSYVRMSPVSETMVVQDVRFEGDVQLYGGIFTFLNAVFEDAVVISAGIEASVQVTFDSCEFLGQIQVSDSGTVTFDSCELHDISTYPTMSIGGTSAGLSVSVTNSALTNIAGAVFYVSNPQDGAFSVSGLTMEGIGGRIFDSYGAFSADNVAINNLATDMDCRVALVRSGADLNGFTLSGTTLLDRDLCGSGLSADIPDPTCGFGFGGGTCASCASGFFGTSCDQRTVYVATTGTNTPYRGGFDFPLNTACYAKQFMLSDLDMIFLPGLYDFSSCGSGSFGITAASHAWDTKVTFGSSITFDRIRGVRMTPDYTNPSSVSIANDIVIEGVIFDGSSVTFVMSGISATVSDSHFAGSVALISAVVSFTNCTFDGAVLISGTSAATQSFVECSFERVTVTGSPSVQITGGTITAPSSHGLAITGIYPFVVSVENTTFSGISGSAVFVDTTYSQGTSLPSSSGNDYHVTLTNCVVQGISSSAITTLGDLHTFEGQSLTFASLTAGSCRVVHSSTSGLRLLTPDLSALTYDRYDFCGMNVEIILPGGVICGLGFAGDGTTSPGDCDACGPGFFGESCFCRDVHVSGSGSDSNRGDVVLPFRSICYASDFLCDEATLNLLAGTYDNIGCSSTSQAALIGNSLDPSAVSVQFGSSGDTLYHSAISGLTAVGSLNFLGTTSQVQLEHAHFTGEVTFGGSAPSYLVQDALFDTTVSLVSSTYTIERSNFTGDVHLHQGLVHFEDCHFHSTVDVQDEIEVVFTRCFFEDSASDGLDVLSSASGSSIELVDCTFSNIAGSAIVVQNSGVTLTIQGGLIDSTSTTAIVVDCYGTATDVEFQNLPAMLGYLLGASSGFLLTRPVINDATVDVFGQMGSGVEVVTTTETLCGYGFDGEGCDECMSGFFGESCLYRDIFISSAGSNVQGYGTSSNPFQTACFAHTYSSIDTVMHLVEGSHSLSSCSSGVYALEGETADPAAVVVSVGSSGSYKSLSFVKIAQGYSLSLAADIVIDNSILQPSSLTFAPSQTVSVSSTTITPSVYVRSTTCTFTGVDFSNTVSVECGTAVFESCTFSRTVTVNIGTGSGTASFDQCTFQEPSSYGLYLTGSYSQSVTVTDSTFSSTESTAIFTNAQSDVTITGGTISGPGDTAIVAYGPGSATDVTFSGLPAKLGYLLKAYDGFTLTRPVVSDGAVDQFGQMGSSVTITTDTETFCGYGFDGAQCDTCATGFFGDCSCRDVFVSSSGSNSAGYGTTGVPWNTVCFADDYSCTETTMHIYPGSHTFSGCSGGAYGLTGTTSTAADHVVTYLGGSSAVFKSFSDLTIRQSSLTLGADVVVNNARFELTSTFTLSGSDVSFTDSYVQGSAIYLSGTVCVMTGVEFSGTVYSGCDSVTFTDCTFSHTVYAGTTASALSFSNCQFNTLSGNAIYLRDSGSPFSVAVTDCTFTSISGSAIYSSHTQASLTITGGLISNPSATPLVLANYGTATDVTFEGLPSKLGYLLEASAGFLLEYPVISDGAVDVFGQKGSGITVITSEGSLCGYGYSGSNCDECETGFSGETCECRDIWVDSSSSDSSGYGTAANAYASACHAYQFSCIDTTMSLVSTTSTHSFSSCGSGVFGIQGAPVDSSTVTVYLGNYGYYKSLAYVTVSQGTSLELRSDVAISGVVLSPSSLNFPSGYDSTVQDTNITSYAYVRSDTCTFTGVDFAQGAYITCGIATFNGCTFHATVQVVTSSGTTTFSDCIFAEASGHGLYADGTSQTVEVLDCTFFNPSNSGIHSTAGTTLVVSGGSIISPGDTAIVAYGPGSATDVTFSGLPAKLGYLLKAYDGFTLTRPVVSDGAVDQFGQIGSGVTITTDTDTFCGYGFAGAQCDECDTGFFGDCSFRDVHVHDVGSNVAGYGTHENPWETACFSHTYSSLQTTMYLSHASGNYDLYSCDSGHYGLFGESADPSLTVVRVGYAAYYKALTNLTVDQTHELYFMDDVTIENVILDTGLLVFNVGHNVVVRDSLITYSTEIGSAACTFVGVEFSNTVSIECAEAAFVGCSFSRTVTVEGSASLAVSFTECTFCEQSSYGLYIAGSATRTVSVTDCSFNNPGSHSIYTTHAATTLNVIGGVFNGTGNTAIVTHGPGTASGVVFDNLFSKLGYILWAYEGFTLTNPTIAGGTIDVFGQVGPGVFIEYSGGSLCGYGYAGVDCDECASGFYGDACDCRDLYVSSLGDDYTGYGTAFVPYRTTCHAHTFSCAETTIHMFPLTSYNLGGSTCHSGEYGLQGLTNVSTEVETTNLGSQIYHKEIANMTVSQSNIYVLAEIVIQQARFIITSSISFSLSANVVAHGTYFSGTSMVLQSSSCHFSGSTFNTPLTIRCAEATFTYCSFLHPVVLDEDSSSHFGSVTFDKCSFSDIPGTAISIQSSNTPDPSVSITDCTFTNTQGSVLYSTHSSVAISIDGGLINGTGSTAIVVASFGTLVGTAFENLHRKLGYVIEASAGFLLALPTVDGVDTDQFGQKGAEVVIEISTGTLCGYGFAGEACDECALGFFGDGCACRDVHISAADGDDHAGYGTSLYPYATACHGHQYSCSSTTMFLVPQQHYFTSCGLGTYGLQGKGLWSEVTVTTVSAVSYKSIRNVSVSQYELATSSTSPTTIENVRLALTGSFFVNFDVSMTNSVVEGSNAVMDATTCTFSGTTFNLPVYVRCETAEFVECTFNDLVTVESTFSSVTFTDCLFQNAPSDALRISASNDQQTVSVIDCSFFDVGGSAIETTSFYGYLTVSGGVINGTGDTAIISMSPGLASNVLFDRLAEKLGYILQASEGFDLTLPSIRNGVVDIFGQQGAGVLITLTSSTLCGYGFAGANCTDCAVGFYGSDCACRDIHMSNSGNDATGYGTAARPFISLSKSQQFLCPEADLVLMDGTHSITGLSCNGCGLRSYSGTADTVSVSGVVPTNHPRIGYVTITDTYSTFLCGTVTSGVVVIANEVFLATSLGTPSARTCDTHFGFYNTTWLADSIEVGDYGDVDFESCSFSVPDFAVSGPTYVHSFVDSVFHFKLVVEATSGVTVSNCTFNNTLDDGLVVISSAVDVAVTQSIFSRIPRNPISVSGSDFAVIVQDCIFTDIVGGSAIVTAAPLQLIRPILKRLSYYFCEMVEASAGADVSEPQLLDDEITSYMFCGSGVVISGVEDVYCGLGYAGAQCSSCADGFFGETCSFRSVYVSSSTGSDTQCVGTIGCPMQTIGGAQQFMCEDTEVLLVDGYHSPTTSSLVYGVRAVGPGARLLLPVGVTSSNTLWCGHTVDIRFNRVSNITVLTNCHRGRLQFLAGAEMYNVTFTSILPTDPQQFIAEAPATVEVHFASGVEFGLELVEFVLEGCDATAAQATGCPASWPQDVFIGGSNVSILNSTFDCTVTFDGTAFSAESSAFLDSIDIFTSTEGVFYQSTFSGTTTDFVTIHDAYLISFDECWFSDINGSAIVSLSSRAAVFLVTETVFHDLNSSAIVSAGYSEAYNLVFSNISVDECHFLSAADGFSLSNPTYPGGNLTTAVACGSGVFLHLENPDRVQCGHNYRGDECAACEAQLFGDFCQYRCSQCENGAVCIGGVNGYCQCDDISFGFFCHYRDLYVSLSGSDETGDGTNGNPFRTGCPALNDMSEDVSIVFDSGTYSMTGCPSNFATDGAFGVRGAPDDANLTVLYTSADSVLNRIVNITLIGAENFASKCQAQECGVEIFGSQLQASSMHLGDVNDRFTIIDSIFDSLSVTLHHVNASITGAQFLGSFIQNPSGEVVGSSELALPQEVEISDSQFLGPTSWYLTSSPITVSSSQFTNISGTAVAVFDSEMGYDGGSIEMEDCAFTNVSGSVLDSQTLAPGAVLLDNCNASHIGGVVFSALAVTEVIEVTLEDYSWTRCGILSSTGGFLLSLTSWVEPWFVCGARVFVDAPDYEGCGYGFTGANCSVCVSGHSGINCQIGNIFISPDGSDVTGAGSLNAPFKDICRSLEFVGLNGTLTLLPGEYSLRPCHLSWENATFSVLGYSSNPQQVLLEVHEVSNHAFISNVTTSGLNRLGNNTEIKNCVLSCDGVLTVGSALLQSTQVSATQLSFVGGEFASRGSTLDCQLNLQGSTEDTVLLASTVFTASTGVQGSFALRIEDSLFRGIATDAITIAGTYTGPLIVITGCEFHNNSAKSVVSDVDRSKALTIQDSRFTQNQALCVQSRGYMEINDSFFVNNSASPGDASVFWSTHNNGANLFSCEVRNNTYPPTAGGGVFIHAPIPTCDYCVNSHWCPRGQCVCDTGWFGEFCDECPYGHSGPTCERCPLLDLTAEACHSDKCSDGFTSRVCTETLKGFCEAFPTVPGCNTFRVVQGRCEFGYDTLPCLAPLCVYDPTSEICDQITETFCLDPKNATGFPVALPEPCFDFLNGTRCPFPNDTLVCESCPTIDGDSCFQMARSYCSLNEHAGCVGSSPSMLSAYIDDLLQQIRIPFNTSMFTGMGGNFELLDCTDLFEDFPTTTGACWFNSPNRLVIDDPKGLLPNDAITLKPHALYARQDWIDASGSVVIEIQANVSSPVADLVGPESISSCDWLNLDASGSTGGGYAGLEYSWRLVYPDDLPALRQALESVPANQSRHSLLLQNYDFVGYDYLEIELDVRNVGNLTSSIIVVITIESIPLPSVAIRAGSLTPYIGQAVALQSDVMMSDTCFASVLQPSFQWQVRYGGELLQLEGIRMDRRSLYLVSSLVTLPGEYSFKFVVTLPDGGIVNATKSLVFRYPPDVVSISGGDRRSVCSAVPHSLVTTGCSRGSVVWTAMDGMTAVEVDVSGLQVEGELNLPSLWSAWDSGNAIFFTANCSTAIEDAQVILTPVFEGTTLSLRTSLRANKRAYTIEVKIECDDCDTVPSISWEVLGGIIDLDDDRIAYISPNGKTLTLYRSSLTPDVPYKVVVSAVGTLVFDEIVIQRPLPPSGGTCRSLPPQGIAYDTRFTLCCDNWVGKGLQYSFAFYDKYGISRSLVTACNKACFKAFLGPGNMDDDLVMLYANITSKISGESTKYVFFAQVHDNTDDDPSASMVTHMQDSVSLGSTEEVIATAGTVSSMEGVSTSVQETVIDCMDSVQDMLSPSTDALGPNVQVLNSLTGLVDEQLLGQLADVVNTGLENLIAADGVPDKRHTNEAVESVLNLNKEEDMLPSDQSQGLIRDLIDKFFGDKLAGSEPLVIDSDGSTISANKEKPEDLRGDRRVNGEVVFSLPSSLENYLDSGEPIVTRVSLTDRNFYRNANNTVSVGGGNAGMEISRGNGRNSVVRVVDVDPKITFQIPVPADFEGKREDKFVAVFYNESTGFYENVGVTIIRVWGQSGNRKAEVETDHLTFFAIASTELITRHSQLDVHLSQVVGHDALGDGSSSRPYETVQRAWFSSQETLTLYLTPGRYLLPDSLKDLRTFSAITVIGSESGVEVCAANRYHDGDWVAFDNVKLTRCDVDWVLVILLTFAFAGIVAAILTRKKWMPWVLSTAIPWVKTQYEKLCTQIEYWKSNREQRARDEEREAEETKTKKLHRQIMQKRWRQCMFQARLMEAERLEIVAAEAVLDSLTDEIARIIAEEEYLEHTAVDILFSLTDELACEVTEQEYKEQLIPHLVEEVVDLSFDRLVEERRLRNEWQAKAKTIQPDIVHMAEECTARRAKARYEFLADTSMYMLRKWSEKKSAAFSEELVSRKEKAIYYLERAARFEADMKQQSVFFKKGTATFSANQTKARLQQELAEVDGQLAGRSPGRNQLSSVDRSPSRLQTLAPLEAKPDEPQRSPSGLQVPAPLGKSRDRSMRKAPGPLGAKKTTRKMPPIRSKGTKKRMGYK